MAFLELDTMKTALQIALTDTSRDAELQVYVDAANATLYEVFGGLLDSVPTEYIDAVTIDDTTTGAVWTRRWPLNALTTVVDKGATLDLAKLTSDDLGLVRLLNYSGGFSYGRDSVVITYDAGFDASDPRLAELKLAALLIAIYSVNTTSKAGFSGERIGQYSYTLAGGGSQGVGAGGFGIPPQAERILAKYQRTLVTWPNAV